MNILYFRTQLSSLHSHNNIAVKILNYISCMGLHDISSNNSACYSLIICHIYLNRKYFLVSFRKALFIAFFRNRILFLHIPGMEDKSRDGIKRCILNEDSENASDCHRELHTNEVKCIPKIRALWCCHKSSNIMEMLKHIASCNLDMSS